MRPRTILWIAAIILLAAAAVIAWWLLTRPGDGSVDLLPPPADATSTITFAGVFPAGRDPRLSSPSCVAVETTHVYVGEPDRGVVREFADNGRRLRTLAVPRAPGAAIAAPGDLAVAGGSALAVVDTVGRRVVLLDLKGSRKAIVLGAGDKAHAPRQPTSVAGVREGLAVADAADGSVKVFGVDGAYLGRLGAKMRPSVSYATGMLERSGLLYAADPNGGRVVVFDEATGLQKGALPRAFTLPRSVTAGPGDTIVVLETFARSVTQLDGEGGLVAQAGQPEGAAMPRQGLLSLPKDIAWMPATSRIYVVDARQGDVKVYNIRLGTREKR